MDQILIEDLEVYGAVGVPAAERAQPQRLLISATLDHDFSAAARQDALGETIDYHAVVLRLKELAEARPRRLLETLAVEMAEMILTEFRPKEVTVEIKKFILPETRYVGVRVTRPVPPPAWPEVILP
jgi:dihydroneopterin aldolase